MLGNKTSAKEHVFAPDPGGTPKRFTSPGDHIRVPAKKRQAAVRRPRYSQSAMK